MDIIITDRKDLFNKYRSDNLFIEAGAGAGKTQFISDKVLDLLIQGVDIRKIVLITFTNKAAEEMLTRISNLLIKKLEEPSLDNLVKDKLTEAKNNLYLLNVSTIHSFCNKLLNENSFKAKVTFNAKLLEEDDEEERRNVYFSKWIKSLKSSDYDIIHKLAFISNPISKIKTKYDALCQYLPGERFDIDVIEDDLFKSYIRDLHDSYNLLLGNSGVGLSKEAEVFIYTYDVFYNSINRSFDINKLDEYLSHGGITRNLKAVIEGYNSKVKFLKKIDPVKADELNAKLIKPNSTKILTYQNKYINIYAKKAFEFYNDNFNKDELSNNYVIYLTYKLLTDPSSSEVKDVLANKYDVLIVDEFQDTDKYQIAFVDELTKAIDERKAKEGNKSTTLVVVGDPKQSIYRFRGADINSYLNYQNHSGITKSNVSFPDNFRSNNLIVDYLNNTFHKKQFHPSYKYKDMVYPKEHIIDTSLILDKDKTIAGVYSYPFNNPKVKRGEKVDKSLDSKYKKIANLVKYLVDNEYQIFSSINKEKTLSVNKVQYSDFLILTHSKTDINDIAKEFNNLGIKTKVAGRFDLSSLELFNAIYSFISYIFNKEENNKKNLKIYFDLLWNKKLCKTSTDYLGEFNKFLLDLDNQTKDKSPYGVLMYVAFSLLKNEIFVSTFLNNDSNLYDSIVYEMLEHLSISKNVDSIHLLNEIEKMLNETPEQQLSLDTSMNEVQIMNVHKAKGLEGNIVIIPDCGRSANNSEISDCKNIHYLEKKAKEDQLLLNIENEKIEEKIRLEYVAASRAKSVLIFESNFDSASNFFSAPKAKEEENLIIDNYLLDEKSLHDYCLIDSKLPNYKDIKDYIAKLSPIDLTPKLISSSKEFKLDNLETISKRNIKIYSPSLEENVVQQNTSTSRVINRPKNNIFGDALHRCMELLINDYDRSIDDIVLEAILEKSNDINDKEQYHKYLLKVVKAIKDLFDKDSSFNNFNKYLEYKFSIFNKDKKELITGSIDLLLIKDDEALIIDYKSDIAGFTDVASFEELLKKRYKPQLDIYKEIISKLFNVNKISTSIIYVEEDNDNQIGHIINL